MKAWTVFAVLFLASIPSLAGSGAQIETIIPLPQGDSVLKVGWRSLGGGGAVGAVHFEVSCSTAGVPCHGTRAHFEAPNFRVDEGDDFLRLVDESGNSLVVGKLAATRGDQTQDDQPVTLQAVDAGARSPQANVVMNFITGQMELQLSFPYGKHNTIQTTLPGVALYR